MKACFSGLVFTITAATASFSHAETPPPLDVAVYDAAGKMVYKTKAGPNGIFTTGLLKGGMHVVQFNANSPGLHSAEYALALYVRNKSVTENALPGEKLAGAGVAMKIEVPAGSSMLGQVANGMVVTNHDGVRVYKLKIEKGWRYIWMGPVTGSNIPGRWVEDGYREDSKIVHAGPEWVRKIQDHGDGSVR